MKSNWKCFTSFSLYILSISLRIFINDLLDYIAKNNIISLKTELELRNEKKKDDKLLSEENVCSLFFVMIRCFCKSIHNEG